MFSLLIVCCFLAVSIIDTVSGGCGAGTQAKVAPYPILPEGGGDGGPPCSPIIDELELFKWKRPGSSFAESDYKELVKQYDTTPPTYQTILDSLPRSLHATFESYKAVRLTGYPTFLSPGQMCARLWTDGDSAFPGIRDAFLYDKKSKENNLSKWSKYIESLDSFIKNGPSDFDDPVTVYRGSFMSAEQQAEYLVAETVNIAPPFSTTRISDVNSLPGGPRLVRITIEIPEHFIGARDVARIRCVSIFI